METFTIDLVHTADDDHVLTAYDADDQPICSLVDRGNGWEITDGVEGERLESLADVECDLRASVNVLHGKMYALSDTIHADE